MSSFQLPPFPRLEQDEGQVLRSTHRATAAIRQTPPQGARRPSRWYRPRRLTLGESCPMFTAQRFAGPTMRNLVCIGALLGFLAAVRSALYAALDAYGFWPYMMLCGGLTTFIIAAAFAW